MKLDIFIFFIYCEGKLFGRILRLKKNVLPQSICFYLTKLLYLERFCNGFSAKKEFRVHVLNVEEGFKFSGQERVGSKKCIESLEQHMGC